MLLRFHDDRCFADGASPYLYRPAHNEDTTNRIFVPVSIDEHKTLAVVDTGGTFLVCDRGIAELLNLDPADGLSEHEILIRNGRFRGTLHRLPLTLMAVEGKSLQLEVTAFVPRDHWPLPSYLGLHCCLEWTRFAVDPTTDTFYFGSIDQAD